MLDHEQAGLMPADGAHVREPVRAAAVHFHKGRDSIASSHGRPLRESYRPHGEAVYRGAAATAAHTRRPVSNLRLRMLIGGAVVGIGSTVYDRRLRELQPSATTPSSGAAGSCSHRRRL
jgi:hypothetical protein